MIDLIATIIRTFIIYCLVGLSIRIMGKRQLGELQPGELIITILISEIVATPITDPTVPLINGIVPLLLLASFEIINSVITRKSVRFRYLTDGNPVKIIKKGELLQDAMKQLRFNIDDVISALRQKDVFNISDVEEAIVETNGTLSVLLKEDKLPLTASQPKQNQQSPGIPCTLIVDGIFIKNGLKDAQLTRDDIINKLVSRRLKPEDVLLMTIDNNRKFEVIVKKVI